MSEDRRVERMAPPRSRRFGKRAFAMLACSYVWVLLGIGSYKQIPTDRPNVLHLMLSSDVRAAIWIVPVGVALCTCWSRRASWVGIALLFMPAIFVMASYGEAWFASVIDGGSPGYPDGWYQSAIYLGACLIPLLAALFPAPPVVEVNTATVAARKARP